MSRPTSSAVSSQSHETQKARGSLTTTRSDAAATSVSHPASSSRTSSSTASRMSPAAPGLPSVCSMTARFMMRWWNRTGHQDSKKPRGLDSFPFITGSGTWKPR